MVGRVSECEVGQLFELVLGRIELVDESLARTDQEDERLLAATLLLLLLMLLVCLLLFVLELRRRPSMVSGWLRAERLVGLVEGALVQVVLLVVLVIDVVLVIIVVFVVGVDGPGEERRRARRRRHRLGLDRHRLGEHEAAHVYGQLKIGQADEL